jgi:hypothetical protein
MMINWIVASAALSLVSAWFIVKPWIESDARLTADGIASASLLALRDKKERALRSLKDLELDFAMGKVSAEDFESSKQALSLEAAAILEELSQHEQR